MGLCLSHCGQAQHKAAVVAVSISHQSSASPARSSRGEHAQADPSQSLKRILHLYKEGGEGRKRSSASPRPSLDDSVAIPHSSELFSLPSEGGSDSDRSRSPSPAGESVASVARSSTSSSGRRSVGVRPGRFSSEKPPIAPRASNGKKTPARKSCSSLGQVPEPHKNLVETIAQLEKFCDVKLFLEKRRSLVRNSSHEVSRECAHENSVLLHDSCRDLAQKLLCFANEHAYHNSHGDGVLSKSMRRCDSAKDMKPGIAELKESAPLEKSVASFLKEVENFVSKVDAAAPPRPLEQVTEGENGEGVSRLPSLRFQDCDDKIQFTDFEATFEPLDLELSETSPSDSCLSCLTADQASGRSCDTTQDAQDYQARSSVSAESESENSPPVDLLRPAHRHSRMTSDYGGVYHIDSATEGYQEEKKPKNSMPQSVLTDISTNLTPAHDPLARNNHASKVRTLMGLKRGVTRSLDFQDGSIPRLEFGALKTERWELTRETQNSIQATLNREESQRSQAAESASIEPCSREGEGGAASSSADAGPSRSQPTKGRVSIDGDQELIRESARTENANAAGETSDARGKDTRLLNNELENSLSRAFDNLLHLLQSPSGELARSTSELLERLAARSDTGADSELSTDGSLFSVATQADILQPCEAESWHDAPASLSTTEQPELRIPAQ